MLKLAMLASHRGSNVRAVVAACEAHSLAAAPVLVLSNNRTAPVLEYARTRGVPAACVGGDAVADPDARDVAMLEALTASGADVVLLLGYLRLLGPRVLAAYRSRVLNIHPALLPQFGGRGMYGRRVHEAVLASGATETGITIHCVDAIYDHGRVVAECRVPVLAGDSVDALEARVLAREHGFLVETLRRLCAGELRLGEAT